MIAVSAVVTEIERNKQVLCRNKGKKGEIGRKCTQPSFFSGCYHGASYYRNELPAVMHEYVAYSPWVRAK